MNLEQRNVLSTSVLSTADLMTNRDPFVVKAVSKMSGLCCLEHISVLPWRSITSKDSTNLEEGPTMRKSGPTPDPDRYPQIPTPSKEPDTSLLPSGTADVASLQRVPASTLIKVSSILSAPRKRDRSTTYFAECAVE